MAIGLFLVMVIGITVIIGEVTKIEQAEQLVTDGYISMEKYYGRVEKKIETCQKYANILTALSDEDMLIAGDISGNMETEEEAIAQYLTEMEKLTKDISEQSLTDSFMTYSSVNKELMEQLKECRQARDDGDIAKAKSIIGGSALEKIQARESACNDFQEKLDENVKRSSQNMKARTQKTYLISVTIGICFLIICLVTYILVNKAIIQPLKKASLQLNQMVEDIQNGNGDLSIRIPVKRMDEIGQLVTGVNLFVEKLQNIMKQLKDGSSDMDEVADKMNRQAGNIGEETMNMSVCTGHTVIENATQTEGTSQNPISQEEFYTYSSYFINSTKGLMISAGFDPTKNEMAGKEYPSNWPSYQADLYSRKYTYKDVKGQTMLIQASDSPGDKRQMQNYNYLIYTERDKLEEDYAVYYSIKISKRDIGTDDRLNGAVFSLKKKNIAEDGTVRYEDIGISGTTGMEEDGVAAGETYIYLDAEKMGKLMVDDGTYVLTEDTAPDGYVARGELAVIEIKHKLDESTGKTVSVVEVVANNKVLGTSEQVVNSTYGDKGMLVNKEIVFTLKNSTELLEENIDYTIQVDKYRDTEYQQRLSGAHFELYTAEEPVTLVANGTTDTNGTVKLLDLNGSEFTCSKGAHYKLKEAEAPENFYLMSDEIDIRIKEENQVFINDVLLEDGNTLSGADAGGTTEYGDWRVTRQEDAIVFSVYDEEKPPTWTLQARKYGTKVIDALALSGAEFTLYQVESSGETEIISLTSSDGTDGHEIGELEFTDTNGEPLQLACNTTYILRETHAPVGYEIMEDIILSINEDASQIEVTQGGAGYGEASYDAVNKVLTLSIIDKAVYRMPETKSGGLYPLAVIGTLFMSFFAVLMLVISQRQQKV